MLLYNEMAGFVGAWQRIFAEQLSESFPAGGLNGARTELDASSLSPRSDSGWASPRREAWLTGVFCHLPLPDPLKLPPIEPMIVAPVALILRVAVP